MKITSRLLRSLLFSLLVIPTSFAPAEEVAVPGGSTVTIDNELKDLDTGTYDNKGILRITANGALLIGEDVVNADPVESMTGLDMGAVENAGVINARQTLQFRDGTVVEAGASVTSTQNIVFNGGATIRGNIEAGTLLFNASLGDDAESTHAVLDLAGGATLEVDLLYVSTDLEIVSESGAPVSIGTRDRPIDLTLAGGATLIVSEDLVVYGNYTGLNGSLQSDKANWKVTFMGGGSDEDGTNNIIANGTITAETVRLENKSVIASALVVEGNMVLGEDSSTRSERGVMVGGKVTLEENATFRLVGNEEAMNAFGSYSYNGVFFGGLELQSGARIETTADDHYLQFALGNNSTFEAGSSLSGYAVFLTGTSNTGSISLQYITSRGSISAGELLRLNAIDLTNTGVGTIDLKSLELINNSKLRLESGGEALSFRGGGVASIGYSSAMIASTGNIDFGATEVVNWNPDGGIIADRVRFGDGGSYTAQRYESETWAGVVKAHAHFESGSTLKLHDGGYADFDSYNVVMETGSIIELSIKDGKLGSLLTSGAIEFQDGVVLTVTDGSQFEGRSQSFLLAQGNGDSTFNADLKFADSLFFNLSDYWAAEWEGDDGKRYAGLVVEILKIADLADYAGSDNQRNLGLMIDRMIADGAVSEWQAPIFDTLLQMTSDTEYRKALDSLSGSIRENAALFALSTPWRRPLESVGFQRLSLNLDKSRCDDGDADDGLARGQRKSLLPSRPLSSGGLANDLWFDAYYRYDKLDADRNTRGGSGNRGGFSLGLGLPTASREALIGLTFGYAGGEYKQDGDKVDLNDYQLGLYAGANLFQRNLQIRGYIGYGFQDYKSDRTFAVAGKLDPKRAAGKTDGTSISAAVYLIRPIDLSPRWLLKPTLGIDLERLEQDGFTEKGHAGVTWGYDDLTLTRTMLRLGATTDYAYRRAELTGRFLYGVRVSGDRAATSRHFDLTNPTYGFDVSSVSIGSSVYDLGIGGNIGLNAARTTLLFLDYNASLTSHSNTHTGSIGILWKR